MPAYRLVLIKLIFGNKLFVNKSTLINKILRIVSNAIGADAIVVTAHKGDVNINSNTIHLKFRLPFHLSIFKDLKDEPLRKFQLYYKV